MPRLRSFFRRTWWLAIPIALVVAIKLTLSFGAVQAFTLLAPQLNGAVPLGDRLYVDKAMSETQRTALQQDLIAARQRLTEFYGALQSTPSIVACATETCEWRFGGRGGTRADAFGDTALRLSPKGLTRALIIHEWSHAEIYHRVGGLLNVVRIPRWFDEGLAVALADEEINSEKHWQTIVDEAVPHPKLDELASYQNWGSAVRRYYELGGNVQRDVVYTTAGHEVRNWLNTAGPEGVLALIAQVREGRPFAEAYEIWRFARFKR